jgi:hypothetical protein
MKKLADGIWRWELRHPQWHPRTEFGAKVACYVVHEGEDTVLIDPLFDDPSAIDPLIQGEVVVAVTIPYHVRSSAEALKRWGGTIAGHPHVQRRLPEGTPFHGDEDQRREWFRRTAAPAMAHLLVIDFAHALVTHGDPVLADGKQALRNALDGEP